VRWLYDHDYLNVSHLLDPPIKDPKILDFGGGHGADTDWLRGQMPSHYRVDSWDLYHRQDELVPPYDIVLCTYVLNVLPKEERAKLYWDLIAMMRGLHSVAYVTVRRDGEGQVWTSRNTFQDYEVDLCREWDQPYPPFVNVLRDTASYTIYKVG